MKLPPKQRAIETLFGNYKVPEDQHDDLFRLPFTGEPISVNQLAARYTTEDEAAHD